MTDVAKIAASLSEAGKLAIFPGPGNPEYARGRHATMLALEGKRLVTQINGWSTGGDRGAQLTPLGLAVRDLLQAERKPTGKP